MEIVFSAEFLGPIIGASIVFWGAHKATESIGKSKKREEEAKMEVEAFSEVEKYLLNIKIVICIYKIELVSSDEKESAKEQLEKNLKNLGMTRDEYVHALCRAKQINDEKLSAAASDILLCLHSKDIRNDLEIYDDDGLQDYAEKTYQLLRERRVELFK